VAESQISMVVAKAHLIPGDERLGERGGQVFGQAPARRAMLV
jgi:hypothetical protein